MEDGVGIFGALCRVTVRNQAGHVLVRCKGFSVTGAHPTIRVTDY